MFVLEYKVKPKPNQIEAINEAIRTTQFVRNKVLRYWMDNRGVGKTELFRYNTALRKEFKFVDDLNSHACQTAVERTLRAITRFYDNWFFGLCYAMDGSYKGWNPYIERHLAIFVNCFLSRAN